MRENSISIKPNKQVIDELLNSVYPKYKDNPRVDILINNTNAE